ncbi:hypothetical protein JDV02_009186 [Purpureocillium takamizusanense]|uniref:Uncharacterized protein n=1 Tax=Purpureocillium takamizusanense TaxID=2060973 RepID=A0A9Q8QRW8_9HYPO|nr:uncharacterized protein JDV02_009186 [Purpureocillium takamizusanense]UNI23362.1 hypothetical protein JDV02_009186 [Purpureocillium takamizusanense]
MEQDQDHDHQDLLPNGKDEEDMLPNGHPDEDDSIPNGQDERSLPNEQDEEDSLPNEQDDEEPLLNGQDEEDSLPNRQDNEDSLLEAQDEEVTLPYQQAEQDPLPYVSPGAAQSVEARELTDWCLRLAKQEFPEFDEMLRLLGPPRQRLVELRLMEDDEPPQLEIPGHLNRALAVFIYVHGCPSTQGCMECHLGKGVFLGCYKLTHISPLCANCMYESQH